MKTMNYRKIILIILTLLLIMLEWYLHTFVNGVNGKYSLISKEVDVLAILLITVLLIIIILLRVKELKNKKPKATNALLLIILILVVSHYISLCAEKVPRIILDIAEGQQSNTIQLNGTTTITDSLFGHSRYCISGITPEGKSLSFEVSSEDFARITKLNHMYSIRINYWEHTSTLYNWESID